MNRRIVLDLSDADYRQRLEDFLDKNYSSALEVVDKETALSEDAPLDVWITDSPEEELDPTIKDHCLCILTMSETEGMDPYRSGHEIARDIMAAIVDKEKEREKEKLRLAVEDSEGKSPEWIYQEEERAEEAAEEDHREIPKRCYLVCPSRGGIGSTTLGRTLAETMGDFGRTLYIELSSSSEWRESFNCDETEGGLSDLIYSFLTEPKEIWEERIEEFSVKQTSGIFFVRSVLYPDDLWALDKLETEMFIRGLMEHFDTVVLETGKQWTPFSYYSLSRVDRLWVLIPQGTDPEKERLRMIPAGFEGDVAIMMRENPLSGNKEKNSMKQPGFTSRIFSGRNVREENVFWIPWIDEGEEGKEKNLFGRETISTDPVKEAFLQVIREAVRIMG